MLGQSSFNFSPRSYCASRGTCPTCDSSCGHANGSDETKNIKGLRQLKPNEITLRYSNDVIGLLVQLGIEKIRIDHKNIDHNRIPIRLSDENRDTLICANHAQTEINGILGNPNNEKLVRAWLEENTGKLSWD